MALRARVAVGDGVSVHVRTWVEPYPRDPYHRRFIAKYYRAILGATDDVTASPTIISYGNLASVSLERMQHYIISDAGGVVFGPMRVYEEEYDGVTFPYVFMGFTTPVAVMEAYVHEYIFDPPIIVAKKATSLWSTFLSITNGGVADGMYVLVQGVVDLLPVQGVETTLPQSVSVDGYKWPLTRRP